MRIKFVNAKTGEEVNGKEFFKDYGKLALISIRVAQAKGGSKEVAKVLPTIDEFLGKVEAVTEYVEPLPNGVKERVSYITFTMTSTVDKDKYSEDTGEFLETVKVDVTDIYYLEVRSLTE